MDTAGRLILEGPGPELSFRLELPVGRKCWTLRFLEARLSELVSDDALRVAWGSVLATFPLPLCAAIPSLIAASIATASGGRGVKMCSNHARCAMELS